MNKLAIALFVTLLPTAWSQSADRAAAAPPAPQDRGIIGRVLGSLEPAQQTPLTQKQRFHDFVMGSVGPIAIFSEAASAGVSQWLDSPPEWGQGGAGYAKRLGHNLVYNGLRNTLTYGVSVALHEDNRYFASGRRTVRGRLLYALTSPAIARKDGGRRTVSVSNLSGIVGASAISRAWVPGSWQSASNVGRSIGFTYAGLAGLNVAREFVPDLVRRLRK